MLAIKLILIVFVIVTAIFSVVRHSLPKEDTDDCYDSSVKFMKSFLKTKPYVYGVLGIFVVIILLFSSIFFTNEQEIGFTSMFGNNTIIEGPGMHFKVPFLSTKHVYDATTQGMPIGYLEASEEDSKEESEEDSEKSSKNKSETSVIQDSLMITSDFNFINIDFYIEYRITDPIEYCYGSNDPETVFYNIAQSSIRNTVGLYDVDSVMTTGKTEIEMSVFDDIVNELSKHHTGLSVVNVTIQDAEPPTSEVNSAFMEVSNAKSKAETAVNEANSYKNTQIPASEAKAEQIKQAANAAKTERVNEAKEEVAKFEALFNEYKNNPETVKQRLYYEALQDILPKMDIIIGEDSKIVYVKDKSQEKNKSK